MTSPSRQDTGPSTEVPGRSPTGPPTVAPTVPPQVRPHEREDHEPVVAGRKDEVIDGRYRLVSLVGYGSYGEVWEALDTRLERAKAVKLLVPPHGARTVSEEDRERFRREARLTAQLQDHPNVIDVENFGEDRGRLFLVMPLLTGENLLSLLRGEGRMDPRRAVAVVRQIGDALGSAHRRDLVHRDVKPANVFVRPDDRITLLDFGIVSAIDRRRMAAVTRRGDFVGTLAYMAPERFPGDDGSEPADPSNGAGDIYSLACILFECLTGRPPFTADGQQAFQDKHRHADRPGPSRDVPSLHAFDTMMIRGLAVSPHDRQGSAADFVRDADDALEAWEQGRPAPPGPPPITEPPPVTEPPAPQGTTGSAERVTEPPEPPGTDEHPSPGSVWSPVLTGGAAVGIAGAAGVLAAGFTPLVDGLVIASSWAAGACAGWWYATRHD